ncbi:MobV family relaxase [Bacteroides caecimuris]|nr:MobV family relaxase [Bacteroides caecimuris]
MSDHIERRVIAPNVDSTRTHLNRELVELPEGVTVRDEAIAYRIKSAGIKRKITPDQVRAIRVMMSGTHEDMMKIQQDGRMNEWCNDSMEWLHKTFGRENTVSAVLHMDETTPHIHATIVPIVTGERRKAKQKQTDGKRSYRKKADAARLCADDVLNRDKLIGYHDDYAKIMDKYGLQRGVRGSEARHVTTAQYYRDLKRQTGKLETGVQQLQEEREEAEKQLKQVKKEIGTQKLEAVKTEAKAAIIAKVGSFLGSGEIKELKQENKQLYEEVATRDESIEKLQALIKEQQKQYRKELTEVQARSIKEQNGQKARTDIMQKWINRACKWFPLFDDAFRVEKLCRSVGFTSEQIDRLFTFKPLEYSGNIYSEEHKRGISVTKAIAQIKIAQDGKKQRFILCINGKNVFEWFKEQFEKLRQIIHPNLQPLIKNKRLKL